MSDKLALELANTTQSVSPYFKNNFKPNIVLIILESFGRDYCGFLNKESRFTPFLDSLSKHSLVFPNAYSSGTTSMESIPAIFASIPSLLEVPYINSTFQNNSIYGIHHYLGQNKYNCSFYYGAQNGSMGFDNFLRISGEIDYFGIDEYPNSDNDFDGNWGIWDQEYLQYFNTELSKKQEPFFSSVFTLTSHDPYQIPSNYKSIFKGGQLPIYKAVQYSDHALKLFFQKASKQKWFDNTVFIITADHPSHSVNEYYYTPTGKYEIPLLIYAPKLINPGISDKISASHTDIMPSIMSLAGIKKPFFAFGKSLFDSTQRYPINKDYGIAQLIDYPYCLRYYPDGKFKMHIHPKYVPNKLIRYQLSPSEMQKQKSLELLLQAKLQAYYNGLLNNQFKK
jgi:phosphoglycerol transferase MdoB-like AlkP superfamily enzyme